MRGTLAGSLLLAAAAATAGAQTQAGTSLTAHQQLARDIYSQLISINTVDSVGSVTKAAEAMAQRFREAGFPDSDVKVLIPADKPTKGNLVVVYHGTGGAAAGKPVLMLAHLDVVAALRSDWPRDPFTMVEQNGFFLGRGSLDDKAMASMFVANMIGWKQEGWRPKRDVVLALTADEEGGGGNGVTWLIRNHKDLVDAWFAINEGGGGTLEQAGDHVKPIYNSIQSAEKVYADFTVTATNPGGHSSMPRPDNAIYELAAALLKISHFSFPVELNPTTREFFRETAKVETPELAAAMRAIVANPGDAQADAVLSRDPKYNSMLRTTCVATRLAGGHANNALPQTATANVNCRMVPTANADSVRAMLIAAAGDTGIKITSRFGGAARRTQVSTEIDPQVLAAVTTLTHKMWGDIPVIPTMSTGATDGQKLRMAGVPTYGVSGIFSVEGENNMHGRDEKLRVTSYFEGLQFLDQLVRMTAGGPVTM